MMKEDPDRELEVFKSEPRLISSVDDEGYTGPMHEESSQILSCFPFKQNPNFLEDLVDGFAVATKSESYDDFITRIKVENTRDEDCVTGPCHESACPTPSASSSMWNPSVVLERINLTLVDAFNSGTKSTSSQDLPSLMTQIKVENTGDEVPSSGPFRESARHIRSASSSMWNPSVVLERIDLNLVDAFNSGNKSTLNRDLPSSMTQIYAENTEVEVPLAGPSVDGRSHIFTKKRSSVFEKGTRFPLERVGAKPKDRPSKGNLIQKKRGSKFDFVKSGDKIACKTHPASILNVMSKPTDCSETVTPGVTTDLDNDSNYVIEYGVGKLVPRSKFLSSEERPGPSKTKSDVQARCVLTQVRKKKVSLLNNSSELVSEKKLEGAKKLISCCICTKQVLLGSLKAHLNTHSDERPFSYKQCSVRFKVKSSLKQHMLIHLEQRPSYSCDQCPAQFRAESSLKRHILVIHSDSDERPFSCGQCPARFKMKAYLRNHLRVHSDEKPFSCKQCPARFESNGHLTGHLRRHSDERPYSCKQCSAHFKCKRDLAGHLRRHSDERPHSCKQCSARFKSKGELGSHLRKHSDERPYSCAECSAQFRAKSSLKRHILVIHSDSDERPFSCGQCPARFKMKAYLRNHLRVHSDEKPFSCKQCPARFKSNGHLTGHLRRHSDERPYSCKQCSARFKRKENLAAHLQRHSDERPYSCKQCSARFKRKEDLAAHLQRHSDERPYSCKQCSARFKCKGSLTGHLRRHSDERPYSCKQCSARFKSKGELGSHLRKHSDEKPYSCAECSAQFRAKSSLKRHILVTHSDSDERPFSCGQCPARFKMKAYLRNHLRVHSDEKPFSCKQCPARFKSNGHLTDTYEGTPMRDLTLASNVQRVLSAKKISLLIYKGTPMRDLTLANSVQRVF